MKKHKKRLSHGKIHRADSWKISSQKIHDRFVYKKQYKNYQNFIKKHFFHEFCSFGSAIQANTVCHFWEEIWDHPFGSSSRSQTHENFNEKKVSSQKLHAFCIKWLQFLMLNVISGKWCFWVFVWSEKNNGLRTPKKFHKFYKI